MTLTELEKRENSEITTPTVTREPGRPTVRPLVDVFENEDEILLVADIPGVASDQLTVRLEDGELTLEGKWHDEKSLKPLSREYSPVDYRRAFVVPEGIDPEAVKARVKDGVVTIHLPKAEAFRPREIPVHAG